MARLHFAYRFDPVTAAEPALAFARGAIGERSARLRDLAKAAVREADASLREALMAVRYDDGWLGDNTVEADVDAKCLVVSTLAQSIPVPSLGRDGEAPHQVVLDILLRDAGWSRAEIDNLIKGDPLSGWLEEAGFVGAASELPGLDDLAGWIGRDRAVALGARLAVVKPFIETGGPRHEALLGAAVPAWTASAAALSREAFARVEALLAIARDPRQALLLVAD